MMRFRVEMDIPRWGVWIGEVLVYQGGYSAVVEGTGRVVAVRYLDLCAAVYATWELSLLPIEDLCRDAARPAISKVAPSAPAYASLDEWLRADLPGEPWGVSPREPVGRDLLHGAKRQAFDRARSRLRAAWPRICRCGAEFRAKMKSQRNCWACVQRGRDLRGRAR